MTPMRSLARAAALVSALTLVALPAAAKPKAGKGAITLASAQRNPGPFVVVGNTLYFLSSANLGKSDGALRSLTIGKKGKPKTLAKGEIYDLVADGDMVAFADSASVHVLRGGKEVGVFDVGGVPAGLDTDAEYLYFMTFGGNPKFDAPKGMIGRVAKSDQELNIETVASGLSGGGNLFVIDGRAFYSECLDGEYKDCQIKSVAVTGGKPTVHKGARGEVKNLTVDATHVYWTDATLGAVLSVPTSGGELVTIASGQKAPMDIAVDDVHVYWTDYDGGAVRRAPKAGGALEDLAVKQKGPLSLTIDDAAVYWGNHGDKTVRRRLK